MKNLSPAQVLSGVAMGSAVIMYAIGMNVNALEMVLIGLIGLALFHERKPGA